MTFGMLGPMGPGIRKVVAFGDRSTGRGNFGANLGRPIVTSGDFVEQHGPVPKLLWQTCYYYKCISYTVAVAKTLMGTLYSPESYIDKTGFV